MRDLLVTAIVIAALVYSFKRPWAGVILWTWLSIMNPHRLTWGFAYDMPFAAMAAGVTLLALLLTKDPVRLPRSGPVYVLVLFVIWMSITTAFAYHPADSFHQLTKVLKIQLMTLVALAVLHEKKHILMFVWVNVFSLAFFGVKGGIFTILTGGGGRVWGPGGFIGGNNEIGLAMVTVIPLLYYAYLQSSQRVWLRWGLIGAMLLTTIAVLGTQSRGAFLGIMAMGLVLWWRAPRKLLTGSLIVGATLMVVTVMSAQIEARLAGIESHEEDSSAVGRLYAWQTAFNIANRRPFGAGFSMYTQHISDRYAAGADFAGKVDAKILQARAAHSIYFQVLGEHGWVGLALYLGVFVLTWRMASGLRKRTRGDPELAWVFQLASMSQVSLAGFAVGGAFLSLAYFDFPYNIMVIVVVTERWLANRESSKQSAASAGVAAPPLPSPSPHLQPSAVPPTAGRSSRAGGRP